MKGGAFFVDITIPNAFTNFQLFGGSFITFMTGIAFIVFCIIFSGVVIASSIGFFIAALSFLGLGGIGGGGILAAWATWNITAKIASLITTATFVILTLSFLTGYSSGLIPFFINTFNSILGGINTLTNVSK